MIIGSVNASSYYQMPQMTGVRNGGAESPSDQSEIVDKVDISGSGGIGQVGQGEETQGAMEANGPPQGPPPGRMQGPPRRLRQRTCPNWSAMRMKMTAGIWMNPRCPASLK